MSLEKKVNRKIKDAVSHLNSLTSENKVVKVTLSECASPFGFGKVTGNFDAERYPGEELLDTGVELEISRFSITWKDKEKLLKELSEVIARFQI